ncbi:uncharacterized protein LOC114263818 [Camellia sinensis]|uniref:uncharacterized protein LOC114263818 n=1 Tax=Camellia sinensis TaxID=4442 RepID=UPI00103634CF|nr:uncharacterized protein LOC114263818 [Camellia sinensis]
MVGLDTDSFRVEGDYTTFIQTHLIPHLTGAHGGERARALAAREMHRETKVTRAHMFIPNIGHPNAFASIHRVHREHSRADSHLDAHGTEEGDAARSLRHPDSTYTDGSGSDSSASTGSTPSSSREERERDRGTRGRTSPPEPILSDDNAETSDSGEAVSRHSKSSESRDDGASSSFESGDVAEEGSGAESGDDADSSSGSETDSNSDVDGDSAPKSSPPRKRMKRASQD